MLYAAWMSLYREESSGLGFGGTERVFAGLGNFTEALGNEAFLRSFGHIALYCVLYIPAMVGGALVLALLVDSTVARARRFFQIAYFLPHAVPGLIASLIWLYLYTPGLSPITDASTRSAPSGTSSARTKPSSRSSTSPPGSGPATT